MVINSSGKSPFEICDSTGKEFKEIYDNQGRLLFKNWNEIQGSLPLNFTSRGGHLLDYRIYGNTVQDGTPTPENPVEVQGCGERTENLFDKSTAILGKTVNSITGEIIDSTIGTFLSDYIKVNKDDTFVIVNGNENDYFWLYDVNKKYTSLFNNGNQFTAGTDGYIRISNNADINMAMVVKSPTRPDNYIPYGYKIPVTVSNGTNSVTTPIYIGSEPLHKIGDYADYVDFERGVVVRNIEKLVLPGNKIYVKDRGGICMYYIYNIMHMPRTDCFCSHLEDIEKYPKTQKGCTAYSNSTVIYLNFGEDVMNAQPSGDTINGLKEYLATQYSAGTPVTVWYVLAEPEEEPLENLLPIQTIKGTNILTANTEVQPSEMYIKYKKG